MRWLRFETNHLRLREMSRNSSRSQALRLLALFGHFNVVTSCLLLGTEVARMRLEVSV
jgi:hypothetical protein